MADRQNQQNQTGNQPQQSQSGGQQNGQNQSRQNQGGQNQPGQQQQFDQSRGQQGGGGSDSRLADQIREHQAVIDSNGQHVGTVDHVDGDQIKLSRKDSADGQHHYVALSQVAGIEGDKVRLR
jgi:hypothetical protein